jgi:hypothetical protein
VRGRRANEPKREAPRAFAVCRSTGARRFRQVGSHFCETSSSCSVRRPHRPPGGKGYGTWARLWWPACNASKPAACLTVASCVSRTNRRCLGREQNLQPVWCQIGPLLIQRMAWAEPCAPANPVPRSSASMARASQGPPNLASGATDMDRWTAPSVVLCYMYTSRGAKIGTVLGARGGRRGRD